MAMWSTLPTSEPSLIRPIRRILGNCNAELGDEFQRYNNIFKSQEEVERELQAAQQKLFLYATDNAELFSQQITALDDKQELYDLRKALETCKELFNLMQLFGYEELAQRFTMDNLHALLSEVNNRINLVTSRRNCRILKICPAS